MAAEGDRYRENRKEPKKDRQGEVALQSVEKESQVNEKKKKTYGRQEMVRCPSERGTLAPVSS